MSNGVGDFTGTPGPWVAYVGPINMEGGLNPFFKGTVALLKHSGEGNDVAVITDTDRPAHDYEANANLIAAAPDILEALQEQLEDRFDEDGHYSAEHLFYRCMECYEGAEDDKDAIKHAPDCSVGKASAAISKALGGAS